MPIDDDGKQERRVEKLKHHSGLGEVKWSDLAPCQVVICDALFIPLPGYGDWNTRTCEFECTWYIPHINTFVNSNDKADHVVDLVVEYENKVY